MQALAKVLGVAVSIHTPVRERLKAIEQMFAEKGRFNSRSREGATQAQGPRKAPHTSFNSRSREGATRRASGDARKHPRFNSRSREGATRVGVEHFGKFEFQFTLP